MLGSWSLGDYDGPQSLRWGCELIVDGLGVSRDRLYATVFGGDEQTGPDVASLQTLDRARRAGRADYARQLVVQRPRWPMRPRLGDVRLDR